MDITVVFEQMLVLLILLVLGVVAAKTGVVGAETNRHLTRFTLVFPQTCMILGSVLNSDIELGPGKILAVIGYGIVMYAILTALSLSLPHLFCKNADNRGLYSFMILFGNVGFMGFPVVRAIFGDTAVFYASLMLIPFNLLAYSLGVAIMSGKGGEIRIRWRQFINPPLVASLAAVVIVLLKIRVPAPVEQAVDMLGDMIVPSSMIIIGSSLGSQKLREVFGDWRVYLFSPLRLLVCPVVLWFVLHFFVKDSLLLGSMTILGGMPVAAFATMFSIQYGGNERFASRTVFVSTVLSVLTIPLLCAVLPL